MAEQQQQQPSFIAGLTLPSQGADAEKLLQWARADGYDFVTTSLPADGHVYANGQASSPPRTDVTSLESKWWSTSIVGSVSDPSGFGRDAMADGGTNVKCTRNGAGLVSSLARGNKKQSSATAHLKFMLDWAGHMSIPAVILPAVPSDANAATNYARLLSTLALEASASNVQLWIRVAPSSKALAAYELLHRRCDYPANLGCILCFSDDDATTAIGSKHLGHYLTLVHRFVGCNLRALSFSASIFLTNKRGFPTLSKSLQAIFSELLRRLGRTLRVLVEGTPQTQGLSRDAAGYSGCLPYLQYLRHVRTRQEITTVLDTEEARMETSYLDHLQSPLQPLGDNLEFQTYETFEKDPIKYARYQDAVYLAVKDGMKIPGIYPHNKSGAADILTVNIMVVGAGRGPLVEASLDAIDRLNAQRTVGVDQVIVKPRITAIEKNSSAVIYLRSLQHNEDRWSEAVTVVECDMRYADRHHVLKQILAQEEMKADVVVSELLGSFGDNELSPECLDGMERSGLMKSSCVSIPQDYTAFLAPVSSMRLYSEAHAQAYTPSNPSHGPMGKPSGTLQAMETPYVVRTHAASQTHPEVACWTFQHPHSSNGGNVAQLNNDRSISLTFDPNAINGSGHGSGYGAFDPLVAETSSNSNDSASALDTGGSQGGFTIHGFLGTFHSTLYQSTHDKNERSIISIAPASFSVGMFSWFPLYFPLREPLHVPAGASICVDMWRKGDDEKVWYEWCAEVFITAAGERNETIKTTTISSSPVHNPNGRSYFVRL